MHYICIVLMSNKQSKNQTMKIEIINTLMVRRIKETNKQAVKFNNVNRLLIQKVNGASELKIQDESFDIREKINSDDLEIKITLLRTGNTTDFKSKIEKSINKYTKSTKKNANVKIEVIDWSTFTKIHFYAINEEIRAKYGI